MKADPASVVKAEQFWVMAEASEPEKAKIMARRTEVDRPLVISHSNGHEVPNR